MINATLTRIGNRAGYIHPALRVHSSFQPYNDEGYARSVRQILRLTDRSSDRGILAVLHAIDACPELRFRIPDRCLTYSLGSMRIRPFGVSHGRLTSTNDGPAHVNLAPDESLQLQLLEDNTCLIKKGGASWTVQYVTNPDGQLQIMWPPDIDVNGRLQLGEGMAPPTAWITISDHCVPYNYPEILRNLTESLDTLTLLNATSTSGIFYSFINPEDKVATVGYALYLHSLRNTP